VSNIPRWADTTFSDYCAYMRADSDDPGDDGHLLAVILLSRAERPESTGTNEYPLERWINEAPPFTRLLAEKSLEKWQSGLPSMDEPQDGEQLPVTDTEYIAWKVDQEVTARTLANAIADEYNRQGTIDDGIAPLAAIPEAGEAEAVIAAEAALEIETHREACRIAIAMIRGV
jgi:hypothetical protein